MSFAFEQIDSSERFSTGEYEEDGIKKDLFVCSTGKVNPTSKGLIFEKKQLVSHSFGRSFVKKYTNKTELEEFVKKFDNHSFTDCFEGPLVKLWYDSKGERHISTSNNIDCTNGFWGDREEKFGKLFKEFGGDLFEKHIKTENLVQYTHHFMIMTDNLFVTLDYNIGPNKCVLVYLGSVSEDGKFTFLDNENVFSDLHFPTKDMQGKIFKPIVKKEFDYAVQTLETGSSYLYDSLTAPMPLYDDNAFGVDLDLVRSFVGKPVIMRTDNEIYKILPYNHQKKLDILGNITPNISYMIFTLMEKCKPKQDFVKRYFEEYDFLFRTDLGYFEYLLNVIDPKYDILRTYRHGGNNGYDAARHVTNYILREHNLIMLLILSISASKIKTVIKEYIEYVKFKLKLMNYIETNRNKILDDKLTLNIETCKEVKKLERHVKPLERLKDMTTRSHDYAKRTSRKKTFKYNEQLTYSLSGFINNERGASLYKIKKLIDVLTRPTLVKIDNEVDISLN